MVQIHLMDILFVYIVLSKCFFNMIYYPWWFILESKTLKTKWFKYNAEIVNKYFFFMSDLSIVLGL